LTGYAEVIVLFNFTADGLLLLVTGVLLGQQLQARRLLLASMIGTIPLFMHLITGWDWLNHFSVKMISPVFMLFVAFKITGIAVLLSAAVTFYFVAFLTGGVLYGFQSVFLNGQASGQFSTVLLFVLSISAAFYFIQRRLFNLSTKRNIKKQTVPVTFSICGIEWSGTALIDTGNSLCDPITKKAVAVCQMRAGETWPTAIHIGEHEALSQLPDRWAEKMIWIPARSLGAEKQLLAAFRTDELTVFMEGKAVQTPKALVTFTAATLSDDQSFDFILHPNMVRQ
jgi:stage II sporulation protein GA (sporulation sigma-E factor processing peptidase)